MADQKKKTVELSRVTVDQSIADGLKRLSAATGAPVQWHRRKAYEHYLQANANSR